MLQCAPHILQCTPPMGHVVTIQHFFQGKSRQKLYTVLIKQNHIIVLDMWEINVGGKNTLNRFAQTEKVKKHYVVPRSPLCEIQHILSVV